MRGLGAILLIALGIFLLYTYNTGRLTNIFHVLQDPNAKVQSPPSIFAANGGGTGGSAHQCNNLLDLNCILSVFDTISGLPDFSGFPNAPVLT